MIQNIESKSMVKHTQSKELLYLCRSVFTEDKLKEITCYAIEENKFELLETLVDINVHSKVIFEHSYLLGKSFYRWLIENNKISMIHKIIRQKFKPSLYFFGAPENSYLINLLIKYERTELFMLFVKTGMLHPEQLKYPDYNGRSFTHTLALKNNTSFIQALYDENIPLDPYLFCDVRSGQNALHIAAALGYTTFISFFIERRIGLLNFMKQDVFGRNLLSYAAQNGQTEIIKLLSNITTLKPQLYQPDFYGNTPLHLAIESGNVESVKALIEQPEITPALFAYNTLGLHPFHLLAKNNNAEIINLFVEKGFQAQHFNYSVNINFTPAHTAAIYGNGHFIKTLIQLGIPQQFLIINTLLFLSNTILPLASPLDLAANHNHQEIVNDILAYCQL